VEISSNPFAADEPTETAVAGPMGRPPRVPKAPRPTQPMRIIEDGPDGHADTIPPPAKASKDLAMTPKVAPPSESAEAKTAVMTAVKPEGESSWDGETVDADDKEPVKLAQADADADAKAKAATPGDEDKDAG
jgi:hypothetical protein